MSQQHIAKGSFETALKPEAHDKVADISFGRFIIDKKFQGDLEATGKVEMLSAGSDNGSGVYVAIERVTGTLHGKQGTFVLMHCGTRTPDSQQLTVTVVPGCGTGQLAGLEGKMSINIVDKKHFYEFDYTLNS